MAHPNIRMTISYVLDWVIILILAGAGGALFYISGFHRPFSLSDITISYPYKPDIVSLPVLVLVSLLFPAAAIVILTLIIPSGARALRGKSQSPPQNWRHRAWKTHVGLLGLALSLASTLVVTSGLKDMVGKPRPDLLGRCNPDIDDILEYMVGGYGDGLNAETSQLVTSGICRQADTRVLDDGFAAFPSGHSSFSMAGLGYLTLWLCARLGVAVGYLGSRGGETGEDRKGVATPPLWQVVVAFVPLAVALFICASRYADFHHAGIDIFSGAVIGGLIAWGSFRLYHCSLERGMGLVAWRKRSVREAFIACAGGSAEEGRDNWRDTGVSQGFELGNLETGRRQRVGTGSSTEYIISRDEVAPASRESRS